MAAALEGLKVLDLSRVLAGPWAGQLLADLGADVVKIERPVVGDDTRAWGPPYLQDAQGRDTSEAAYYLSANRNKRSLALDFTQPQGQQTLRELVAQAFWRHWPSANAVGWGSLSTWRYWMCRWLAWPIRASIT